ncbi:MAG: PIN domain-containing protein [Devosia sp.]
MLLLVVGLTDKSYIASHNRLDTFGEDDFDALRELIDGYDRIVACPNVWSETSNFVRYAKGDRGDKIATTLQRLVAASEEVHIPSEAATNRKEYLRVGITDSVLLELAQSGSTLLTDDRHLYHAAATAGYDAINYNHLRAARYDREQQ